MTCLCFLSLDFHDAVCEDDEDPQGQFVVVFSGSMARSAVISGGIPAIGRSTGGVCHDGSGRNWSFYHVKNGIRKTCEMTLSSSYGGRGGCCSYSCGHRVGIESN